MSRVQCLECGTAVVVDPSGVCPEGHLVGRAGVRVAGAMGSDVPHPDEPEPWVATVVLDEEEDASPAALERTIRPLQVAGADAATEAERGESADHDSVLRELHALGDVRDATLPSAGPEAALAPVAEAPPVAHVPPPPQEQVAEGFAELSALEAAFHALRYDEDATPGGDQPDPPTANTAPAPSPSADRSDPAPRPVTPARDETGPSDDFADVDELFAPPPATDRSDDQPSAARDPASNPAPTTPSAPDADDAPSAKDPGLDITNFTARGSKVGSGRGGRRRLFGR